MAEDGTLLAKQLAGQDGELAGLPHPLRQTSPQSVSEPHSRDVSSGHHDFARELVEEAETIVKDFREGKITKSTAVGKLFIALDLAGGRPDQDARVTAFKQYRTELEKESELEEEAGARGQRVVDAGLFREFGFEPTNSGHAVIEDRFANLERLARKRRGGDGEDDDDESLLEPGKKQKLERGQLPWGNRDDDDGVSSNNPGGVQNRKLLQLFSINPSFVVSDIRFSAVAPPGFPNSEWHNIVRGNAVNLDHVLSALHHLNPPKESVGHLGDRKITFGTSKPVKVVETQADWHSAWASTSRAYTFVFEHRREELDAYGLYILQLFAAKVPSAAGRVILYDRAIRNFVGGGQCFSLTDTAAYSNLREAILAADGVESQGGGGSKGRGARRGGGETEICERFNRGNGCNWKDGQCKYRHACKSCGSEGHGKTSCKGGGGEKA